MFHKRLRVLFYAVALLALGVVVRLGQIQILEGEQWQKRAGSTKTGEVPLPAIRGSLRDRNGVLLAQDRCAYTVKVFPSRFRERSLVLAIRDICVFLDIRPRQAPSDRETGSTHEQILHIVQNPTLYAHQLLKHPASVLAMDRDLLEERGKRLWRRDTELGNSDEPPLGWGTRGALTRMRRCLAVIRGTGGYIGPATMGRMSRHGGTLAEGLGVTRGALAARLDDEAEDLAALGRSVGFESLTEILISLDQLLQSERQWINRRVGREVRSAVFMEHLGVGRPTPASLGLQSWVALARETAASVMEAEDIRTSAWNSTALLAGRLPKLPGQMATKDDCDVGEEEARALHSLGSDRVRAAFFDQIRSADDYDQKRYMSAFREGVLRRQLLGGRTFNFGKGADPSVASLVIGPGRLETVGFRLEPAFVREVKLEADTPSTYRLIGLVNSNRKPLIGVERELDEDLRDHDGRAHLHADGSATLVEPPRHGQAMALTISVPLQVQLDALLEERGAIAVLDARSGAILGLVGEPIVGPDHLRDAVLDRMNLDTERTAWRRRFNRGEPGSGAELRRTQKILGESRAFHLGFEHPGYSPPGSVFKALTVLMALEKGIVTAETMLTCDRGAETKYSCHLHGPISAVGAIKHSCNFFCYEMGQALGRSGLVEGMDRVRLFDRIPGLLDGMPLMRETLLSSKEDSMSLAIGRGSLSCYPVQVAGIAASLATGLVIRPHLIIDAERKPPGRLEARAENLELVREGMREVVRPGGTAWRTRGLAAMRFAGKTGTARLGLRPDGGPMEYNSWFVGFVPWDAPRYAIAVLQNRTTREGAEVAPLALATAEILQELFGAW